MIERVSPTLSPLLLAALVPASSTLETAWVVLIGHHEQIGTHRGRPLWSPLVSSWSLLAPCPTSDAAGRLAELLGVASLGAEPDEWRWHSDDRSDLEELWAVIDGDETAADVAIAPLTVLLHPEATPAVHNGPEQGAPTFTTIPRESA
ncbi:hypothetical protein [Streptosporangium sp. NPDC020145]|uniref:hypothetical protein n=1 Tax=Streptosporangium sp. NPDC020145 TaxID=3154694 RepID=UPI003413C60D